MDVTLSMILRAVVGAFVGTVGFAMLVHVPKRSWLPSGVIAAASYLIYWLLVQAGLPDPMGIFIGSLFGSLTGQMCARKMKMIGTVFLMSAIVPVVPGLGLYRMMSYLGQGQTGTGVNLGIQAMITIAMIALGLSMGSFIDRLINHIRTD
ncbi:MAG: threonine/serine exporter family protein [Bacteroidales bacterium]|nr:threonine/serine exporter family protein [Bacteroidales bacterium]